MGAMFIVVCSEIEKQWSPSDWAVFEDLETVYWDGVHTPCSVTLSVRWFLFPVEDGGSLFKIYRKKSATWAWNFNTLDGLLWEAEGLVSGLDLVTDVLILIASPIKNELILSEAPRTSALSPLCALFQPWQHNGRRKVPIHATSQFSWGIFVASTKRRAKNKK